MAKILQVCVNNSWVESLWLLLEDIVDQDLKEDEENDDDVITLMEEGASFCPGNGTIPQCSDVPANTQHH